MLPIRIQDKHPAIAIKSACLARSGEYKYTYEEMCARGFTPKIKKPIYTEYRPKEVLERCKDKFAFAVSTIEHTQDETDHTNFHKQVVGVIGDNIVVKPIENGEIGLFGNMCLYTQDGYEYYSQGNKETSADYRSVVKADETGKYDFILQDIQSVNGVVLTAAGRGGPSVRVQDSLNNHGGLVMAGKKGALSFLGIGRAKDDGFSLAKLVLDGAKKLHTMDAAGKEKLVTEVMGYVNDLGDGQNKDLLIGAVKDAFAHPVEVVAKEKDVARVIDGLYNGAVAADIKLAEDAVKALDTKDAKEEGKEDKEKEDKKEKDKDKDKEKSTKDAAPINMEKLVDAAVEKSVSRALDGIGAMIDKSVKAALNIKDDTEDKKKKDGEAGRTEDSLDEMTREEGSFLLQS